MITGPKGRVMPRFGSSGGRMRMSLETVRELLNKHKLVEGMVHNQNLPRQDVVETMVHRQHLSELGALLAKLPASEISAILEALPLDDAKLLWKKIPKAREKDVLWEIPDALHAQLADVLALDNSESQINAFELSAGRLRQVTVSGRKDLESITPIWVDLVSTGPTRRAHVGAHFGEVGS